MSARDVVLQTLDEDKLSALLAAKKITPAEYKKFSAGDEASDLLAAIEGLPETKPAKKPLRKGHPCVEIEEVEAFRGTRMFRLFFINDEGKKTQCCKLGEVKLGTIANAVNSGMFETAKIHIPSS